MKSLPEMEIPQTSFEMSHLTFFDGKRRKVYVTEEEFVLGSKVIYSKTDLQGIITGVNDTFVEASGWTEDELVGCPHYVLRHPHMPKAAFQDLWLSLSTKGNWSGYVKNLRKNGGYYWVHAVVHSIKRDGKVIGYQSVRHRITDDKKNEYEALYAKMRQSE